MIEEIKQYKTSDGKIFDKLESAHHHEQELIKNNKLNNLKLLIDKTFPYLAAETKNQFLIGLSENYLEFIKELSNMTKTSSRLKEMFDNAMKENNFPYNYNNKISSFIRIK